jgi:DNA-binding NarL/FixJ family response regulator
MPGMQVVGEASDGLEAVRQVERLQPDLVLLDIELPTLDGMSAARQIRKISKSKIIFVTQESDADIVQTALALGAWGYVVKAKLATDLFAAVEAVCDGRKFVSDGFLSEPHYGKFDGE